MLKTGELYKIFFALVPRVGMEFHSENWKHSFFLKPDDVLLVIDVDGYGFAKVLFGGRLGYVLADSTYVTIQQIS